MEGAPTIKTSIPLCGLCAMLSPLRVLAEVTRGRPGVMDERLWVDRVVAGRERRREDHVGAVLTVPASKLSIVV
jgi:hypothetical protein